MAMSPIALQGGEPRLSRGRDAAEGAQRFRSIGVTPHPESAYHAIEA